MRFFTIWKSLTKYCKKKQAMVILCACGWKDFCSSRFFEKIFLNKCIFINETKWTSGKIFFEMNKSILFVGESTQSIYIICYVCSSRPFVILLILESSAPNQCTKITLFERPHKIVKFWIKKNESSSVLYYLFLFYSFISKFTNVMRTFRKELFLVQ